MPIYAYECPKCKKVIELLQPMDKKLAPLCVEEGCTVDMEPIISVTNFSLKGHGWYKDGYSSKKE